MSVTLSSLAPRFEEAQHRIYLGHLEHAVTDARNRNIALSGSYGTGKSSILDEFEAQRRNSTLRLAISTLAPDTEGATLTNRIQKEVLKQLVYSAHKRTLRHSRFSRFGPLSELRAATEAALFVGIAGTLLALFGLLPRHIADGAEHSQFVRISVWAVVAIMLIVVFAVLRMVTYNRFVVSDVSAGGAALKLSAPTSTYFDEYLDEIVYFFDQEPIDFVIFEDLDRYNDPKIFQALRELNTLLNNTPKRLQSIEERSQPLRFIYAMRDSLFENIGDNAEDENDVARAENVRANRTKFFEIVIPVVPFISHRSAREHLQRLVNEAGIIGVGRSLVELVAKHITDMRLMLNIRNEYLVFAQRLLNSDKVAPDLSADQLFALVAYKNFHAEDFENIARRSSDLDRLYDYHRDLVASSIAKTERAKRDLLTRSKPPPALRPLAKRLGGRLVALGNAELDRQGWRQQTGLVFNVDSHQYDSGEVLTPKFWQAVVEARAISVQGNTNQLIHLAQEHLEGLFPEALKGRWEERDTDALKNAIEQHNSKIEYLRGAGFRELVDDPTVTFLPAIRGGDTTDVDECSFAELVDRTLKSALAHDLVKHGYIDRNFTLYAAQFYGDFTGVDVATFIVHTVQTNSKDVNYSFTSPGAVANLLAETEEDFTRTISAYNVQVVNYLLVEDQDRADEVVTHLITHFGTDAREFLSAFFTANGRRAELAARLSAHGWPKLFDYLSSDEAVPADSRTNLINAAILAADPDSKYELGPDFVDFLLAHYEEMPAFTEPQSESEWATLVKVLRLADVLVPNLGSLNEELRMLLVENNLYELTARNLRIALGMAGGMALDRASDNNAVYRYCLNNLPIYLDAVENDDCTTFSTETTETLVEALNSADDDETIARLAETAAPESSITRLKSAPEASWPALAAARLFRGSIANVEAYCVAIGGIDEHLGGLLAHTGAIYLDDGDSAELAATTAESDSSEPDRAAVAIAVLNASGGIASPERRVQLVQSLDLDQPLPPASVEPEASNLFAMLIERGLVPDDASTFTRLRAAGWAAVEPAIISSKGIEGFFTPDLVEGMIAPLLANPATSRKIGRQVLSALAAFVPDDDRESLAAAAAFAVKTDIALPVDDIRRIATTVRDGKVVVQLLRRAGAGASDIVTTLNQVGGAYSNLSTWEHTEFDVPNDDDHKAVFKVLSDANICKVNKKPRKELLVVKQP